MLHHWVVLVEGVCTPAELTLTGLRRLLQVFKDTSPVALHESDRCALQFHVRASNFPEALAVAVARWDQGTRQLGWPQWKLLRAEVLTLEEFLNDCRIPFDDADATPSGDTEEAPDHGMGEDLLRRALQDPSTGLEGPDVFAYRLEQAAAGSAQGETSCAVLVLDLDNFGAVRNGWGSAFAEQLVAAVARRLSGLLKDGEKGARLGADRFAVLMENASEGAAVSLAERLLQVLRAPFHLDGRVVAVTPRVGVAAGAVATKGDALLRDAVSALQAAKKTSRSYHVHRASPDSSVSDGPRNEQGSAHSGQSSLSVLRETGRVARASGTLEEAVAQLLPLLCTYTGCPVGLLGVIDRITRRMTPTSTRHATDPVRFASPVSVDARLCRRVMTTRRPGAFRGSDGELALVVPILADEEAVGVLQFLVPDHREFDAEVLETLALVGTELGTVVSRSRAAAAIAEMEATFRALVRQSSELLMVVDEDLVAHAPYPTAALGAASHWQPTPLKDLLHPDDYSGVMSALAFARVTPGAGQHFRCRIRVSDGSWHRMEVTATSVFDHGGPPQLVLNAREVGDERLTQGGTGVIETRASAPRRYELFGWDPAEPAPSLDQFLRHGGTATVGKDLGRLLADTYRTLAGVLQARSGQDAPQE